MKLSEVAPELRGAYRVMRSAPVSPWMIRMSRRVMPLLPRAKTQVGDRIEEFRAGGTAGVRVYSPVGGGSGAALLWIHGGGMILGSAVQDDRRCLGVARRLGVVVVSVEYRLAPEHPFPAPLDDCRDAWAWLVEHAAERGVDPSRLAIGGQSAGGGLAAALVQRIHDEGGVQPVAQWLFCPMLDDRTAAVTTHDATDHLLWNNRANRIGWSAYLGEGVPPGSADVPDYASPSRRADLAGLPPAWIGAGDIELFSAECRAYADALEAAGVPTEFDVVPGAPHAFESLAARTATARSYRGRANRWLAGRLGIRIEGD